MIRTPLLAGFATLALLSAPAMAQNINQGRAPALTPRAMPMAPGFGGLASTNVSNATNLAAGIGNSAQQRVTGVQGGGPGSLVSTNVGTATNVAAGIGNSAGQSVGGIQGNGVRVGLNFTGRGPLVSTDVLVGTNVAAGIGNSAGQGILAKQR
ncbi:hypothetical protein [Azospirillum sp.]|uniref:hypothetical protein n=1 Tax=Azospirillum sp. TaxID=34012 RepID=UPI003D702CD8